MGQPWAAYLLCILEKAVRVGPAAGDAKTLARCAIPLK